MMHYLAILCLLATVCVTAAAATNDSTCEVSMRIESGLVCGRIKETDGAKFASFSGVPYAEQPVGKLRFQELQPVKPWQHHLNATEEGPICPQQKQLYGRLIWSDKKMNESCIYANVHVPIEALTNIQGDVDSEDNLVNQTDAKYPILVYIHGGGFREGSGDTDCYGPEYLVKNGVIVITFNYRLNVFGFLSLNTTKIPGNAGLRDQVTLLRWVQRNARAFGGDPDQVTLGGQSAGAACAHLLALSNATEGLFKRVIIMSGTAMPAFYTTSPVYASTIATGFLKTLGINATDPDIIHDELINMPLEDIINANSQYQNESGIVTFLPVLENEYPGITRIIDEDPMTLIESGRDKEYPMVVGFANKEAEFFRYAFEDLDMVQRIKANPLLVLAPGITYSTSTSVANDLAELVIERYFNGTLNLDDYLESCTDTFFKYPAFRLVRMREQLIAADTYLYQFAYDANYSVLKDGLNITTSGSPHVEDMTNIFYNNAMLADNGGLLLSNRDVQMSDWMTSFIINFIKCNDPSCGKGWEPVYSDNQNYNLVTNPGEYNNTNPTDYERDMITFHDKIHGMARNSTILQD